MNKNFVSTLSKLCLACLFLVPTALMTLGSPPVKELVLYYPLDAAGQEKIKDFSGNNNCGKATGIIVSNSPSLVSMQQTRQLTIAIWIKPESLNYEFPVVVSKGGNEAPGAFGGYELLLNANGVNDLQFISGTCEIDTHGANGRWINNHIGEWVHVVFTINDKTKAATFYVNGVPTNDEYDYGTYFNSNVDLSFNLPNNLYVGMPDPANNANRSKFDGDMQNLMIFNRALTANEVKKIFANTKPVVPKKG